VPIPPELLLIPLIQVCRIGSTTSDLYQAELTSFVGGSC
jgi:hypothetical protein